MTEYVLPPSLRVSGAQWGVRGSAAAFSSPFNGATRTYSRGGDLWAAELSIDNASNQTSFAERAYYAGLLAAIKSKANRVWMSPPGYVRKGSFPATELFTNADFAQGTTGWVASVSDLSADQGVLRVTANQPSVNGSAAQLVVRTAFAPHALRSVIVDGPQTSGLNLGRFSPGGLTSDSDYGTGRGLGTLVTVPDTTQAGSNYQYPGVFGSTTGYQAGAYFEIPFASIARCFLVDNSPNEFANSLITGAGWTIANATATANYYTAPDGTTTGARLREATDVSQTHYEYREITRTNAVADWFACGYFRTGDSGSRRAYLSVRDTVSGTHGVAAVLDLSTGTISSAAAAFGSASAARAFVQSVGGNWYFFAVGCRMPASGTTVGAFACTANSSNAATYNGDGTSNIGVWHLGLAQSGVPFNPGVTTGTAVPSGATQATATLRVKGLPVSTSGLLLPGDFVQIGSQLDQVIAPLRSDAAGLGYLQLSRPQRTAPADNAAVIVHQPMGRFLFAENDIGYSLRPGQLSDYTIPLIEDVA